MQEVYTTFDFNNKIQWLWTTNEDRSYITIDFETKKVAFKQTEIAETYIETNKEQTYNYGFIRRIYHNGVV